MHAAAVRQGKHGKVPITMAGAREESETALNVCIQKVLDRTGLKPHQVSSSALRCSGTGLSYIPSCAVACWRMLHIL